MLIRHRPTRSRAMRRIGSSRTRSAQSSTSVAGRVQRLKGAAAVLPCSIGCATSCPEVPLPLPPSSCIIFPGKSNEACSTTHVRAHGARAPAQRLRPRAYPKFPMDAARDIGLGNTPAVWVTLQGRNCRRDLTPRRAVGLGELGEHRAGQRARGRLRHRHRRRSRL